MKQLGFHGPPNPRTTRSDPVRNFPIILCLGPRTYWFWFWSVDPWKQSNEHRGRYANILATSALSGEKKIDFHHPQTEKNFREVLSNLCDALREQFRQGFPPIRAQCFCPNHLRSTQVIWGQVSTFESRSGKQKLQILPALGKLLILAARYDEKDEEGNVKCHLETSSFLKSTR